MFDFLFKRSGKRAGARAVAAVAANTQPAVARPDAGAAKQAAMEQAAALTHDEAAAAEFIAQCPIADARLAAAEHVRSQPMLERTLKAVRNTDRRVARLMQTRLDALQRDQRDAERAAACLRQAEQLASQPLLSANQVADLDRSWNAIAAPGPARAAFDSVRERLRIRLEDQAGLQRAVRDLVAELRQLGNAASSMAVDEVRSTLDRLNTELDRLLATEHAAALPSQLAAEFRERDAEVRRQLDQLAARDGAMRARDAALSEWEQAASGTLDRAALTRAWRAMPALDDDAAAPFEQRFAQVLAAIGAQQRPPAASRPEPRSAPIDPAQFMDKLAQLEQALQDGSLQAAAETDRALRMMEGARIDAAPAARLAVARAELHRLQAWARWGGNVSREELLKAALALPADALAPQELAKRVGSLRARWKSLDVSAGPAHRETWERFDAACSAAYAPAAAHFERLAQERTANLEAGRRIIEDVRRLAGSLDAAPVDWKELAQACMRTQQAWRQLGPIDRKEKKQLDRDFEAAMQHLQEPLAAERRAEIGRRERLIEEVAAIDMQQRGAADAVRALQERWQQQSKSLPLERRDEQALWQRFRAACDAAFATRKQAAAAADHEREVHRQQKEALCLQLEQAQAASEREMLQQLREAKAAWNAIGQVPRAAEQEIEQRFAAALATLQGRLDRLRDAAADAARAVVRGKLELCLQAEAALAAGAMPGEGDVMHWRERWEAFAPAPAALEKPLRRRFDAALDALAGGDRAYAERLDANRPALLALLLKAEIVLAIDSPAGLSRERLQLQVQVLQSSLKAGKEQATPAALLRQLLDTPAAMDDAMVARLMQVVERMPAGTD